MSSAISLRLSDPTTVGYTCMGRKSVIHRKKHPQCEWELCPHLVVWFIKDIVFIDENELCSKINYKIIIYE